MFEAVIKQTAKGEQGITASSFGRELFLDRREIERLIEPSQIINAVRQGFIDQHRNLIVGLDATYDSLTEFGSSALVVSKRAYSEKGMVIKLATLFAKEQGGTTLSGAMLLIDRNGGRIRTFLSDQAVLTSHRTAAAGALASQRLSKEESESLLVVGSGSQAKLQAEYHALIRPLQRITFAARNLERATEIVLELRANFPQIKFDSLSLADSEQLREASLGADIIVTTTASTESIIQSDWVSPGTHISAIGSDRPGKRELAPELLRKAKYYYDDLTQAVIKGEAQGVALADLNLASLGSVLSGEAAARENNDEITIFDSTGVGHQDLSIALLVEEKFKAMMENQNEK